MIAVELRHPDGRLEQHQLPDEATLGRGGQADLKLASWRVAQEHARLFRTAKGVLVEDLGSFGGTELAGRRVEGSEGPIGTGQWLAIGPFRFRVLDEVDGPADASTAVAQQPGEPRQAGVPHPAIGPVAVWPAQPQPDVVELPAVASVGLEATHSPAHHPSVDVSWRRRVHAQLLKTIDLRRQDISAMSDEVLRAETGRVVADIVAGLANELPAHVDRALLVREVLDEAVGLGPLEPLLADEAVTEVMVNRHDQIYVERAGRLERHPLVFTDDRAVLGVIERIVAPLGRRIDESSPMVDARLKDGSRVNAVIPPLALKGPCITIRKFARRKLEANDLVRFGSLSPEMALFLEICVKARKNIVVSGGTGSGKTTLLNILSNFIPPGERVITVEDAAELQLHHAHLVSLESRPSNVEGKGGVPIRELVRNTLRMRPDRIVVGECRGAEALDMLQAMNTGHEGSLTTLHANTPRDGLARLETMVLMAGMDLPLVAIREQIASAVDLVVQQTRFACGTRAVTSITEVTGIESGKVQMQEIFRFQSQGLGANGRVRGVFSGCDLVPQFYEELAAAGQAPDLTIFKPAGNSLARDTA
jgi:pilus assembly protein CpaF